MDSSERSGEPVALAPSPPPQPIIQLPPVPKPTAPSSQSTQDRTPERLAIHHKAVDRFLILLGWLHEEHRENFSKVLRVEGSQRRYFATSPRELEETGTSVHPAQIPRSGYWVITNNDTPKKARMMDDVLQVLNVPFAQRMRWIKAIKGELKPTEVKPWPDHRTPEPEDGLI